MSSKSPRSAWLPPGQVATQRFPIVGERDPGAFLPTLDEWELCIEGAVAKPRHWSWSEIAAIPFERLKQDIHCVTGWSHAQMEWEGFPLKTLVERCQPLSEARFVRFVAYSPRSHDTSLPLEVALEDTWLCHRWGGEPLTLEHGYPLRTVTPSRYFYKSLKWVHRIELLEEDQPGYWERESSYHNRALPENEERYTTGSLKPRDLERFRKAENFDRYRRKQKVILQADLRDWEPATKDLRGLQIKNSDLQGAALAGCDFRGANLTRCRFEGADLRGANLEGADLEGADFAGADLRDANFHGTFLSATLFVRETREGQIAAKVDGLQWDETSGLLESQEKFLLRFVSKH